MTSSSHRVIVLTDTDEEQPDSARDRELDRQEVVLTILAHLPIKIIHGVVGVSNPIGGVKAVRQKAWMHHEGDTSTEPAERWKLTELGVLDPKKDAYKLTKMYTHRFIRATARDVEESKSDQDAKTSVQEGQQAPAPSEVSQAPKTSKIFTPTYPNPLFAIQLYHCLTRDGFIRRCKDLDCDLAIMPIELRLKNVQQVQHCEMSILDSYLTRPPTTSGYMKLEYKVDDDTFAVSEEVKTSQPLTIRRAFAAALAGPGLITRVTTRGNLPLTTWQEVDALQDFIIARESTRRGSWSIISGFQFSCSGVVFPQEQERAMVEADRR